MKKFLAAIALLLTSASVNVPAQKSKILQPTIKTFQNQIIYSEAKAFSDGRGVWLGWKTNNETRNLGFYVYRVIGGEKELVSSSFIPGASLRTREDKTNSGTYSFFDRKGSIGDLYVIESYHANGQRKLSNLIQAQFVEDLTPEAGVSSEQLETQARNANPAVTLNDSVLPDDLAAEVANASLPADPVKQRWVAAQSGVKFSIKNEGFYRVSRAELQNAGFDVNAPNARWQLYVNGVEQAINVGANGDFIEFYGKGKDTLYADMQVYFLVVGAENGKRIANTIRRRTNSPVASTSYSQYFFKKDRSIYLQVLLNGEAENFYGLPVINTGGGNVTFNLSGVDFSSPTATIEIKSLGIVDVPHQIRATLNNAEIGIYTTNNLDPGSGTFTVATSLLREGANTLRLNSMNPGNDTSLFDSVKISFNRRYLADQNRLSFYVPNYKNVYAEGFTTSNVRVFDLTNSDAPLLINNLTVEPSNGGFRVNIPSHRSRVLYAVENSGFLTPASIAVNNPSTLSTAAHNADLVIVSHKDFLTQANTWADFRRNQGMSVKVVNVEDVLDEFSFGAMDADCIREFLRYAKNNWQTPPRYVLFMGDATYDPKNYLGAGGNFVPTRLVDTVYTQVGSDDTLADFNDDGLAELAVGRIPAKLPADVTLALNKVTSFEQTVAQAPARGVLFASDLPDGYDFAGLSNRLCNQLPASIECTKINRGDANAPTLLFQAINQSKYIVNYSGHGNAAVWATGGFFGTSQAAQLTNPQQSIFTMLTCLNGDFIDPTSNSLAEVLLKNPNGGAVSAWASSGLTTPDIQEIMATRFYNQIGAGSMNKMGDLVNDAKTTINFGRDVRLSWVLLGDPTMKVK